MPNVQTRKGRTPDMSDPTPSADQQIEILREQLLQAQRLAALGELVGTTTHEFNNVLMTILNYAKMGLRYKDDATREKAFQKILTASQRATQITNSVLGMARNRSQQMESTSLAKLIEESLVLLERELNKYRIAVEASLVDVPNVVACGNQIQQVLMNLIINARQAMPNGGRLIIRLAHDPESQTVDLIVRDFGSGMDSTTLQQIFDPFFTTKQGPDESGKGGTGIGLSACRDIIEQHGGKIRVESSPGKGTCFTIKLPQAKSPGIKTGVPVDNAFLQQQPSAS